MPTLADQDDLPYISTMVKEIYKWHVLLPINVPKLLREVDNYKGYQLPKGTAIMENIWAVFQDPVMHPEPHIFNPERFLKDGKLDSSVRDPDDWVFGSADMPSVLERLTSFPTALPVSLQLSFLRVAFAMPSRCSPLKFFVPGASQTSAELRSLPRSSPVFSGVLQSLPELLLVRRSSCYFLSEPLYSSAPNVLLSVFLR